MKLQPLSKIIRDVKGALSAGVRRAPPRWDGETIPEPGRRGRVKLKFTMRSRKRLGWMGFVMRIGTLKI